MNRFSITHNVRLRRHWDAMKSQNIEAMAVAGNELMTLRDHSLGTSIILTPDEAIQLLDFILLVTGKLPDGHPTGFHASDGWYFSRTSDGGVRIEHRKQNNFGGPILDCGEDGFTLYADYSVPENIWASIVCSVSEKGEDLDRWMQARSFHGYKEKP